METRPAPEEVQPALGRWDHAWRYAACLVISAVVWLQVAPIEWDHHRLLFWAEIGAGVAAYVLVGFRRRSPLLIAMVVALLSAVSGIAAGPATLAAVSLATRRNPWQILAVGTVNFLCATSYTTLAPFGTEDHMPVTVTVNLVINAGLMGWGMYLGSRRELVWTLRARAQRAEDERDLRVLQARSTERAQIAREMHDVLAHRITQVSMHAGALAFREDLGADTLRSGLGDIQEQANTALRELRGVLGVLRDEDAAHEAQHPQPTHADIARLIAEATDADMNVTLVDEIDTSDEDLPEQVGRTLYRIVQEGVTNARKHAPGARLTITLGGNPVDGVDVTLRNRLGFASTAMPGAGLGLIGLGERAELAGGRLHHHRDRHDFVLQGWLPWHG